MTARELSGSAGVRSLMNTTQTGTEHTVAIQYADVMALIMAAPDEALTLADAWLDALSEEPVPASPVSRW